MPDDINTSKTTKTRVIISSFPSFDISVCIKNVSLNSILSSWISADAAIPAAFL